MPNVLAFICYLIAFGCFLVAAFASASPRTSRVNLIALGLAAFVLVPLVDSLVALD